MKNEEFKILNNSIGACRAYGAVSYLKMNIQNIKSVDSWAKNIGISRVYLYQLIKRYYKVTPSMILADLRLKTLRKVIEKNPNVTSYAAAIMIGLKNEKALYKFLKSNFGTHFTELRLRAIRDHLLDLK